MNIESLLKRRQVNNDFINDMISSHKLEDVPMSPTNTESVGSSNMTDQIIKMFNYRQKTISSPKNNNNVQPQILETKGIGYNHSPLSERDGEAVIIEIDNIIDRIRQKYSFAPSLQEDRYKDDIKETEIQAKNSLNNDQRTNVLDSTTDDLILEIKKKIKTKQQNEKLSQKKEERCVYQQGLISPPQKVLTPKRVGKFQMGQQERYIDFNERQDTNLDFQKQIKIHKDLILKQQEIPKFIEQQQHSKNESNTKSHQETIKDNLKSLQRTYRVNSQPRSPKSPKSPIDYEISETSNSDQRQSSANIQLSRSQKAQSTKSPRKLEYNDIQEADFTFQTPHRIHNFEVDFNLSQSQSQISIKNQTASRTVDQLIQEDQQLQDLNDEENGLLKELQYLKQKLKELDMN